MNIDRLVMRTAVVVGLMLVVCVAIAGTTAIQKPGDWALKKPDNTIISRHATLDECVKAAPAGKYKCDTSVALDVTGTCDDVPKPALARELDADGFVIKPPIRGKEPASGNDWTTEIQDYVPAPYPTCWVLGWREIADADLVEPQELVDSNEPVTWPADVMAEWSSDESQRARHLVHICYEDDTLPCEDVG